MGRDIKRVALDFKWPLKKVWFGFLNPYYKHIITCPDCKGSGESPRAKELANEWYGYKEFDPTSTGSTPFLPDNPKVRKIAIANTHIIEIEAVCNLPKFNKTVLIEAERLCHIYNKAWRYHLSQDDVDVLWELGRLFNFTTKPTAKELNEAYLGGMGHDSINQWICIKNRCKKEGVEEMCSSCKGEGSYFLDPEMKKAFDEWTETEPPQGEGYQVWENVSEGSPISPVFARPEDLAKWMIDHDTSVTSGTTYEQWLAFITKGGYAPSFVVSDKGLESGVENMANIS